MGESKIRRQKTIEFGRKVRLEIVQRNKDLIAYLEQYLEALTGDEPHYFSVEDKIQELNLQVKSCEVFLNKTDRELDFELRQNGCFKN